MNSRPSLPEEVFLLALRDNGAVSNHYLGYALGGAILAELMMRDRLGVSGLGRKARVAVLDPSATRSSLLDQCLEKVAGSKPRRLYTWVTTFARTRKLKHQVAQPLCARGIVRAKDAPVLFVFRRRLYPLMDRGSRRDVVDRIWAAVSGRAEVDPRTATLVAIAHNVHLLRKVLRDKPIGRPHKARIKEIAKEDAVGAAVRQAVSAAAAAASTGVVVATPAST